MSVVELREVLDGGQRLAVWQPELRLVARTMSCVMGTWLCSHRTTADRWTGSKAPADPSCTFYQARVHQVFGVRAHS